MISDTHTVKLNESFVLNKKQQQATIIAIEEMAELTQVLSKLIRFGYTPGKRDNLIQELGDVRCMINLLHELMFISYNETDDAMQDKQIKLMTWSKLYE